VKKQVDYLIYSKEYDENYMDAILQTEDWEKHSGKYYQLEHELIKNLKGKDGLFFMDDLDSLSERVSVHKAISSEIFQDEIRSLQNKGWSVIGNIRFDFKLLEEGLNAKEKDKWRANFKLHMVKYES
jgi:hypothetical protein